MIRLGLEPMTPIPKSGEIQSVASDRISVLLFLEKKRRKIDKKLME
jgi:hypothetical protein